MCNKGFYTEGVAIPSWIGVGNTGVFNPTNYAPAGILAKDEDQVGYIDKGSLSQTLADVWAANTTYTLQVEVGHRNDIPVFPGYLTELLAGGNVIEASIFMIEPGKGNWATAVITHATTADDAFLGAPLEIRLTSNGSQTLFDNVRLNATAIPEPLTTGLLGLGLLGLAAVRRRSMNK